MHKKAIAFSIILLNWTITSNTSIVYLSGEQAYAHIELFYDQDGLIAYQQSAARLKHINDLYGHNYELAFVLPFSSACQCKAIILNSTGMTENILNYCLLPSKLLCWKLCPQDTFPNGLKILKFVKQTPIKQLPLIKPEKQLPKDNPYLPACDTHVEK